MEPATAQSCKHPEWPSETERSHCPGDGHPGAYIRASACHPGPGEELRGRDIDGGLTQHIKTPLGVRPSSDPQQQCCGSPLTQLNSRPPTPS